MDNKFKLAPLVLAALIVLSLSLGAIHPVNALTPVSTLYITPNASQPVSGSTFTVSIFGDMLGRSASSGINSWDLVFTDSDPTAANLNPTAITTTGNLLSPFGQLTTLVNCVNAGATFAINTPGNIGCDGRDGPGVVHTALGVLAPATPAPISGLVATITYTVTGFSQDTISILSPCPGVGTNCDTLADGSGTNVPHITLSATIITSALDYAVTATNPAPFNPGGTGSGTITATSLNAFAEAAGNTLKLTTDVSGFSGSAALPSSALSVSCGAFSPNPLIGGGVSSSSCTFSSSTPGVYVVTGNVTDGPATCPATPSTCTAFHLVPITVSVGDFSITGPAGAVSVPVGNTLAGAATAASVNGFAGAVAITKSVGNPDFTLAATSPQVPATGSAISTVALANANGLSGETVTLSTTVPAALSCSGLPATSTVPATLSLTCSSTTAGTFIVTVTGSTTIVAGASSFTVTHTATAAFTYSTLPDFAVSAKDANAANAGDSAKATISVFTINGGSGTKTVSLSTTVAAGLTCSPISPASVILPPTQSVFLSCNSATTGSFPVTITATNTTLTRSATTTFNFVNILTATCPASVTLVAAGSSPISCSFLSSRPGSYLVTVIGTFSFTGGSISHQGTMTVNIGDFTIATTSNQPVDMASGATTATAQVKLTGLFGWNRQVAFTTTTDVPGLTGNCGAPVVPTPAGVLRTCTLTSTTPGAYTITVTATCGTAQACAVAVAHSTTVTVRVQDISIQYTGVAQPITFVSGGTNSTTFTVSSLPANSAGFAGTANIATTINPLTGLSVTCPTSVILTAGATSPQQTCTFNSSTANTYTVTLNATALITTGQSVKHVITITVIVKPAAISHPTSTTISCHPTTIVVNNSTSCLVTVTDTSASPTTPSGTVTFTHSGTGTFTTCSLTGTGASVSCTATYTPTVIGTGTHTLSATYSGDSTHSGSPSGSVAITVTVRTATTSVTCTSPVTVGSVTPCNVTITDTSLGTAITASGTFNLATNATAGSGTFSGSCVLAGTGASATCSVNYTPTGAAPRHDLITANYPGDTNHGTSSGSFLLSVTAQAAHATTTTMSCHPTTIVVNNVTSCIVTVTDLSGTPTTPGGSVTFTSSGTGTFSTCTLGGSGGVATCSVTYTPTVIGIGTHLLTPSYGGDSSHGTSSGQATITVTVRTTTTTITCSPSPVTVNTQTSCTATVMDTSPGTAITPGGTVAFTTNATAGSFTLVGSPCTLGGGGATATCQVTYTPSGAAPRHDLITGTYSGDANHSAGTPGTFLLAVTAQAAHATTTTITCHPTVIVVNNVTDCKVTVTDISTGPTTPTGAVSLSSSGTGTVTGTCNLAGTGASATCLVTYAPTVVGTGVHTLTATYSGDSTHATSQGTANITVQKRNATASVSCSPSTVAINQTTTCTANVQDTSPGTFITPTGTVTFTSSASSGVFTGTCTVSGSTATATCTTTYVQKTTAGSTTITANYVGDTNHNAAAAATTTVTTTLRTTSTTIACTPSSVNVGQQTKCTATVADTSPGTASTPTGTVSFSSNSTGTFTPTSCTLTAGSCSVMFTAPATRGHSTITGNYSPSDTSHSASSGSFLLAVNVLHATTTSVSCSPTSVAVNVLTTCTATVTDSATTGAITPTGTVAFGSSGIGSFSTSMCMLSGTGASASCTASVTYTPAALGTGTHMITGTYSGDAGHNPSNGTFPLTVTLRTNSTTVSCAPASLPIGLPSTCTATVADTSPAPTSTPTGTVTFTSTGGAGTFSSTNCTLSGGKCSVMFAPTTTTVSSISASYGGDATHSGSSTATAATVTGILATFTITATSPLSVPVGTSATSTITITAQSGFTGTVSLSDSPLPTGLTCQTLNPTSVTLPPSPSTALLSCTSATPAAYAVTMTAASGSLTQTATVTFTFTPISQNDFTLSISPTSITLVEDSLGHSFVMLHSNGFNGTVDLSVKISPTGLGLTARLVRVQVRLNQTSTQRILLVVSGDEAKAGDYTVTVTGTSGTLSHSASLKVTVAEEDFTLSVSPASISLVEDSLGRAIMTLHSNGFKGKMNLSVKISPTGHGLIAHLVRIHVPLGPTSIKKIVLLVSGDEAEAGDYTVTVTGTSGSLSHSASLKVTVTHLGEDERGSLGQSFS